MSGTAKVYFEEPEAETDRDFIFVLEGYNPKGLSHLGKPQVLTVYLNERKVTEKTLKREGGFYLADLVQVPSEEKALAFRIEASNLVKPNENAPRRVFV